MATIEDVFPPDDPVARFMLSMWAVRNDLSYVVKLATRANEDDRPEFTYLVRLASAHLFEGAEALRFYRETYPAVISLLDKLPEDGKKAMKKGQNVVAQVGKKAIPHSRNQTFHYPSPDTTYSPTSDEQLRGVLEELGPMTCEPPLRDESPPVTAHRLPVADLAMLRLALDQHELLDPVKYRRQIIKTQEAAIAFVNFAESALDRLSSGTRHLLALVVRRAVLEELKGVGEQQSEPVARYSTSARGRTTASLSSEAWEMKTSLCLVAGANGGSFSSA